MTAARRNTPALATLAKEESCLHPVTVPTDRRRASPTAAAAATAPATATARRARCPCLEAAKQVPVPGTTWAAAAAVVAPVRVVSATTAVPSFRRRAPSSAANAAWLATRDVTAVA